ncbi:MAG: acyltransferase [Firmicutes bacterium]|nr:acyltransferase [Bacillota bacterium]
MRVAMGQVSPVLGDVPANVDKHIQIAQMAYAQGAQLIVFPELGLTGYLLKDMTYEVARPLDHPDVQRLVAQSKDIDVLFSLVEESASHRFHISAVYASGGKIVHVHRKVYLPTYGLFEEGRHAAQGTDIKPFTAPTRPPAGVMICEDAWHPSVPYLLSVAGVDVLYVPAAGPGRALSGDPHSGSQQFWERLLRTYAQLFTCYVVFVNRVGFEDGVFFFGQSFAVGPDGEIIARSERIEEDMPIVDIDLSLLRRARYRTPLLRDEDVYLTQRILQRTLGSEG